MGSLPEENLKITFFTDAPFIVKFRFEKYRYLLTFLLCIQIFEAPLSHSHSTGPQNISAGRLVPLSVACLVWWHSFRPQIYDESETDQILNAKYFVWKNYTLGKWGSRKAFNQNSLMQLFNGDRRIVHWWTKKKIEHIQSSFSGDLYIARTRTEIPTLAKRKERAPNNSGWNATCNSERALDNGVLKKGAF